MATAAAIRPPAVRIRDLSKAYLLVDAADRPTTLAETVARRLRNPLGRARKEQFWALKGVTLDIANGDVVGIVGRNGAGKSTLLKVLSRITEPTLGQVELFGRVGSLLEVGTGFHPELTGRENIFLNGAILGMRRSEIRDHFDEIVKFAEVAKFLDTPVKRYSSGMYVRLAFAVAAHLQPEILIVDEVLAVGDAEFQKKCLGKMHDVASSGRTVLFVSHNMGSIRSLCSRAAYMRGGQLVCTGPAEQVVDRYLNESVREVAHGELRSRPRSPEHVPVMTAFSARPARSGGMITTGSPVVFEIECDTPDAIRNAGFNIFIESNHGERILGFSSAWERGPIAIASGRRMIRCRIDGLPLIPGQYLVTLILWSNDRQLDLVESAAVLDVGYADYFGTSRMPDPKQTRIVHRSSWDV